MLGTPFQQEIFNKLMGLSPVYIVGGAVRDSQFGLPYQDIDAVVALPLERIEENLLAWGYKPHRLGAHKPTLSLFYENERVDLLELPEEIAQDALRRDFTLNAIYYDLRENELIDPLSGLTDLQEKFLRSCGEANERFREDPLRILRMVRLAVQYDLTIDPNTWQAALEALPLLAETAGERITDELSKILVLENIEGSIRMLDELGYWQAYLPELARLKGLVQNKYHAKDAWEHTIHAVCNTPPRLLLRLAALFHDIGKWEVASRECYIWGKLTYHEKIFYVEDFRLIGKNLQRWKEKMVEVHGARLDNYPDTVQVKRINALRVRREGYEMVPDGKRHFLNHEKESGRIVRKILPRFRFSMFLNVQGRKGETELIYLVENHMIGTLTFMSELRGEMQKLKEKARRFAWEQGWDGHSFNFVRINNLLTLWRADYFGGKNRAEGDVELFERVQKEILKACKLLEERWLELDWHVFDDLARQKDLSGERFGRFKEQVRNRVMLDDKASLTDIQVLEHEYQRLMRRN